jgi:hypothetical protein
LIGLSDEGRSEVVEVLLKEIGQNGLVVCSSEKDPVKYVSCPAERG